MFWDNKSKNQKLFSDVSYEQDSMIGGQLNFAASEAYKLLRTNLTFSFPDDDQAKVVGVTSSLKGEGKSLTTINLAYTIAETGKKVLLVECDMRLPTISKRLDLKSVLGLSDLLVGECSLDKILHESVLSETLDIISAGTIPPNASELLESERMSYTLEHLSKYYDYILLDLPPVTVVSDALIVSKLISGMIVVVRQDYAEKPALAETMRQLKYVNAKVLGFVFNSAESTGAIYDKKYYRKYGYSKYGYNYGYGKGKTKSKNAKETPKK